MNYRFENIYTRADAVKREIQARNHLNPNSKNLIPALIIIAIQFSLWSPIIFLLKTSDIPFHFMAILLFVAFIGISIIVESALFPHISAYFSTEDNVGSSEKSREVINVDDKEIRICEDEQEIVFKWAGIRSVEDKETTVFLYAEKGYCSIPAKCFPGFLEKDAFVRECEAKISAITSQGAAFT